MGIHIHRSERTDQLASGLADLLRSGSSDPFTPEVVAVPTRGVERFIAQTLSQVLGASQGATDGVCANVLFPSPAELVNRHVERHSGLAELSDPWRPARSVWPLLKVIDENAGSAWCQPLARHLGLAKADLPSSPAGTGPSDHRQDRRFAVASRIAALFHSYATQRPQMLLAWALGEDTDGAQSELPADLRWQPQIWRLLRHLIGVADPAERLAAACNSLAVDPARSDLPGRVSVFGLNRLPEDQRQLVTALGRHREVHLWLADASPRQWERLTHTSGDGMVRRRRDEHGAETVANALLRSLGRDSREMALRLKHLGPVVSDDHRAADLAETTLLARLQRSLREDSAEVVGEPIRGDDRSVQVHACHGPGRQADVLREVVLHLLAEDESLQPRDILVMCPDLPLMAPLITAAFSDPSPDSPIPALRVRVADRTPAQANGVLTALDLILGMCASRVTLSELMDLVRRAPVRQRFGLDEHAVERIEQLAVKAGIKWGLDSANREEFGLAGITTGTMRWGLDRMIAGIAMTEASLARFAGVLPLADVSSTDVKLVGVLGELLSRLGRFRTFSKGRHHLSSWTQALSVVIDDLLAASGSDSWQMPHAHSIIHALDESAGAIAGDVTVGLADIRWMLSAALAGRPTRSNFRSGGLTICGLEPMRSVPHRVICLVGLDEGAFPRTLAVDGDDILLRDPLVGERDARSEDRQTLLDAVMAAADHLVITYTGADDRTNQSRPPCVPLGELLDALTVIGPRSDEGEILDQVVLQHPLQPFDTVNFTPGRLFANSPFSHDRASFRAATVSVLPRTAAASGLDVRDLPEQKEDHPTLDGLAEFLRSPARAFLIRRLGIQVRSERSSVESLLAELDALNAWEVGDRCLRLLSLGHLAIEVAQAERGRGHLPPGRLADDVLREIGTKAVEIWARLNDARPVAPRIVTASIDLPSGRRLTGSISNVFGEGIIRGTYSKRGPKQAIALWPDLLALAASEPGAHASATIVCADGDLILTAPPAADALRILDRLLDLQDKGSSTPLPMPVSASREYAFARRRSATSSAAEKVAGGKWLKRTGDGIWGDATAAEHQLLYGPQPPMEALLAASPPAWLGPTPEPTFFGALAVRVWDPILNAMGAA